MTIVTIVHNLPIPIAKSGACPQPDTLLTVCTIRSMTAAWDKPPYQFRRVSGHRWRRGAERAMSDETEWLLAPRIELAFGDCGLRPWGIRAPERCSARAFA